MTVKKKIQIIKETITDHFGEDFSTLQREPYLLMNQLYAYFLRHELKMTIVTASWYVWGLENLRANHAITFLKRKVETSDIKRTFEVLQNSISKNLKHEVSVS